MGAGVHPEVDISLGSGEDLYLNMGHAMAKDTVSQPFTLTNNSPLPVKFKLAIESLELNANPAEKFSEPTLVSSLHTEKQMERGEPSSRV